VTITTGVSLFAGCCAETLRPLAKTIANKPAITDPLNCILCTKKFS
jgi:hypothetical protein